MEYKNVGEFLTDIRKEFRERDKESVKIAELKRLEQEKTMKKFIQEFKRAARGSEYKRRLLVVEFKKRISAIIHWRLMELEW